MNKQVLAVVVSAVLSILATLGVVSTDSLCGKTTPVISAPAE